MNIKAITYYLSFFCFPIGLLAFINILYSSYFDYFLSFDSYVVTLILSFFVGLSFFTIGKKSNKKLNFFDQILLIISIYFFSSILISIPYYLSNYQIPLLNSLFEAFSGVTSTGFSIFENIKYLDPTLILWRSSSQWLGGFYFLIFIILLFSNKQFNYKFNHLTYSGDGSTYNADNIKENVLKIFLIYSVLTILILIFLSISEIRLFNALNLSMTLISNGGFLPTNSLNQIIRNNTQEFVLILSFVISMLNIFLFFNLFNKRLIINNHQEDFMLVILFVFFTLILLLIAKNLSFSESIIGVLSSLSNSGIYNTKIPNNIALYFLILSIVGGSLVSNTSGIKFMRIYILLKATSSEILKLVRPNNVINQNIFYTNNKITADNIKLSFLIFISFFISLFILSGVLMFDSINFETSFKLSILTLTNTTTSELFGINNINFSNLLTSSKISLIIFMIIGKIELISIFLIIKQLIIKN